MNTLFLMIQKFKQSINSLVLGIVSSTLTKHDITLKPQLRNIIKMINFSLLSNYILTRHVLTRITISPLKSLIKLTLNLI